MRSVQENTFPSRFSNKNLFAGKLAFSLYWIVFVHVFMIECSAQPPEVSSGRFFPPGAKIFPLAIPLPPPVFLPPLFPRGVLGRPIIPQLPITPQVPIASQLPASDRQLPTISQGDIRFEITEDCLQQLLSRQEKTSDAIQDYVLGAQVSGQQTTLSQVFLNCQPSRSGARFDFDIQGTVQSATTAFTPQAAIRQQGNSQFRVTKPVLFDGTNLLTQKSTVLVMPNQKMIGAQSRLSNRPLIGPLADEIALRAAKMHTAQGNLVAGQKIVERLQPKIDSQIEQRLKLSNQWLKQNIWDRLEQLDLSPVSRSSFSTQDKLFFNYQFLEQPVNGHFSEDATGDIRMMLHKQVFDRLLIKQKLAGKRFSLNAAVDQFNVLLQAVDQNFIDNPGELPIEVHFSFAESSPLQVSFQDQHIELMVRGKFQIQDLPASETQRIRLVFVTELNDDQLVVKAETIEVQEELSDGELGEPGFAQRAFVTQFEALLRPVHIDRHISLPLASNRSDNMNLSMNFKQLLIKDDWLVFCLDVEKQDSENASPTPALAVPLTSPPAFVPETTEPSPAKQPALRFPTLNTNP